MTNLTPSELAELRAMLGSVGLSEDKQDEAIHILDNIAKSWADQAHGMSSIQISLSARANYRFAGIEAYAIRMASTTIASASIQEEADLNIASPEGQLTP